MRNAASTTIALFVVWTVWLDSTIQASNINNETTTIANDTALSMTTDGGGESPSITVQEEELVTCPLCPDPSHVPLQRLARFDAGDRFVTCDYAYSERFHIPTSNCTVRILTVLAVMQYGGVSRNRLFVSPMSSLTLIYYCCSVSKNGVLTYASVDLSEARRHDPSAASAKMDRRFPMVPWRDCPKRPVRNSKCKLCETILPCVQSIKLPLERIVDARIPSLPPRPSPHVQSVGSVVTINNYPIISNPSICTCRRPVENSNFMPIKVEYTIVNSIRNFISKIAVMISQYKSSSPRVVPSHTANLLLW